jgi:hypothetical protein
MKTKMKLLILLGFMLGISFSNALAQEVQVPIDSLKNIEIIDEELEDKLNLFPEYENFREARLFQKDPQNYILEISYKKDGKLVRTKKDMTAVELENFRISLNSQITVKAPSVGLDHSGRAMFLTGTTMLSLGYYGWSVPYMLNTRDEISVGLYMITAGAGFFLPYSLTKESKITKGMANLSIGAATMGLAHGALLWDIFGLSKETTTTDPYGYSTSDYNARSLNLFMTVTSVSELLAGYFYAKNNNVSEGRANIINSSSIIGGLYGLGAGIIIKEPVDEWNTWTMSMPALVGTVGGAAFGNYLANQQHFAPGDATVMTQPGVIGGLAGGTLLAFIEPDDYRIALSTIMLSTALGFYVGNELIKGYDFSTSYASYISLGTFGGGLVGTGLAAIFLNDSDGKTVLRVGGLLVTAGTALGYGLTYNSLRNNAKVNRGSSTSSNFNLNLNPTGFFAGKINKQMGTSIPFMTLQFTR